MVVTKQIEESIKGVNINNYRSRFSMRSSARLPRLSVRSSSSVAPGLAAKSASAAEPASDAAPASAAEPAKSASAAEPASGAAPASAAEPASDAAYASAAEPATAASPNLHICLGEKVRFLTCIFGAISCFHVDISIFITESTI